ncbi:MAG TPA: RluA family pseudouridine synthase, partial [bacterium]|nr:RluA family pseudouridine synthase [bacterium]
VIDVDLHTGRTHQIRVHLAHIGHPVAGDAVYGGAKARRAARGEKETPGGEAVQEALDRLGRQALHAREISFTHPASGRRMKLEAPIPDDMKLFIEFLRGGK